MITSFFPGRIRLRSPVFKDSEITEKALKILKKSDAVQKLECNPSTGSVLLEYDTTKILLEKLNPLVPFFEKLKHEAENYDISKKIKILAMLEELENIVKDWN